MSFWNDAVRALREATLMQYKVEQALTAAKEAQRHSEETRERLVRLETAFDIIVMRAEARRPRLPER